MKQTYVVIVEDTPGALNRIVNQFRRRNINIQSLAVAPCEQQNISRVTIVVNDIPDERQEIYAQTLKNLVDVIEVQSVYGDSHIGRSKTLKMTPNQKLWRKPLASLKHTTYLCWGDSPDTV